MLTEAQGGSLAKRSCSDQINTEGGLRARTEGGLRARTEKEEKRV